MNEDVMYLGDDKDIIASIERQKEVSRNAKQHQERIAFELTGENLEAVERDY